MTIMFAHTKRDLNNIILRYYLKLYCQSPVVSSTVSTESDCFILSLPWTDEKFDGTGISFQTQHEPAHSRDRIVSNLLPTVITNL